MRILVPLGAFAFAACLGAQTVCNCDPAKPETMTERQCSLCSEADKHPGGAGPILVKDINPRKPNRTILLPRAHKPGLHVMAEYNQQERTDMWTAAINKGKELWGNEWGVAYNGDKVRTQCHAHIHIGKLLPGVEFGEPMVVSSPSEIPLPDGHAIWVHPVGDKLHVHRDDQIAERYYYDEYARRHRASAHRRERHDSFTRGG